MYDGKSDYERTNRQTDRHTHHNTLHPSRRRSEIDRQKVLKCCVQLSSDPRSTEACALSSVSITDHPRLLLLRCQCQTMSNYPTSAAAAAAVRHSADAKTQDRKQRDRTFNRSSYCLSIFNEPYVDFLLLSILLQPHSHETPNVFCKNN